ncbi:uncharacterized protein M421DRAFT_6500 [Didymella exigua CBS 183.55]|uniref:Uncharacterized protein n=1 Tax=Didymella exigua CBS 183.55 TaxID=1150837 RepID=A0A6A5RF90_9PLEO|nr:uncharacterized protein M421DRAFT_6500 [Didymella exigua CBS 183.55]KAF1926935.1 hypothetical protein M421DRAFT_6500 [Didymella exigua CBS 183.55]
MDEMSSNTTPAFTRLPAELLILILDQQHSVSDKYAGDIIDYATLKSLRLACRQFAHLPKLLGKVFKHILIIASPEQVQIAESLDLSSIKPYVRVITMAPSKYSWTMTEHQFRHIVSIPRIEEICQELSMTYYRVKSTGGDVSGFSQSREQEIKEGWQHFLEKHTDGKMPYPETEIVTGYERYMQCARRTRRMFEENKVHHAWTKVFTQLPDVHSFRVGAWGFDGSSDDNWRDLSCEPVTHRHNYNNSGHNAGVCRQLQEPVGEALLRTAIASLIAAGSIIAHLEIDCVLDSKFVWADDGTLRDLDLSRLQTLTFDPIEVDWWEKRGWTSEYEATAVARCGLALSTILHTCRFSLSKLILYPEYGEQYIVWPPAAPNRPLMLPALRSFRTGMSLDLPEFARFLLQSPALQFVQLDGCSGRLGEWRELWDAIRNHPNRMTLEFDQLPCNSYTECSVYHYTGEDSKADFDDDPWDNIQYSLENYLSGNRHWDRTLRMWFEDGGDEPTDSEDDEDDAIEGEFVSEADEEQ